MNFLDAVPAFIRVLFPFVTSPGPVYGFLWKPCIALLMGCYVYFTMLHTFTGV